MAGGGGDVVAAAEEVGPVAAGAPGEASAVGDGGGGKGAAAEIDPAGKGEKDPTEGTRAAKEGCGKDDLCDHQSMEGLGEGITGTSPKPGPICTPRQEATLA